MRKAIIFSTIIALALLLVVVVFFSPSHNRDEEYTALPIGGGSDEVGDDINELPDSSFTLTGSGGEVLARDITSLSSTVPAGGGMYYLGGLETVQSSFNVIFNDTNDSFAVAITAEPINENRIKAEAYLQSVLGVSQEEMCQLDILVGVPMQVNERFVGQNLGVSYCPDSIPTE